MPLFAQDIIHKFEVGSGSRWLKGAVGIVGVVALALFYNMAAYRNFSTPEAMDAAQLARNISEGKGFTTDFVRPAALDLLKQHSKGPGMTNSSLAEVIDKSPDLSNPPVYPLVLAGVLKVMPFDYPDLRAQRSFNTYAPELWIAGFNQLLLLISACLVFCLARRLFDEPVAWLAAAVFVGTELFWHYSASGLPVLWLTTLLLATCWLLARLDANMRKPEATQGGILAALLIGLLAGLIGLTRYALLLLIVPLLIYMATLPTPRRVALALAAAMAFAAVVVPWLARNHAVSGTFFGTSAYAALQDTAQFPGDSLFRSLAPDFSTVTTSQIARKVWVNLRHILVNEVPRLGGSWVTALFLAGLLVPFRNVVTSRIRTLLLGFILLLMLIQAAVSPNADSPAKAIGSSDYLTILAPLAFIFGVSLLFNLLDQFTGLAARYTVGVVFFLLACAPLLLTFVAPPPSSIAFPPYYPPWLQDKARHLTSDEWMMSDIPWAVAWYGDRKSVWLSLKHGSPETPARNDFYSIDRLKPLSGLHLSSQTLRTLDISAIARWRGAGVADSDWELFRKQIKAIGGVLDPTNQNQAALDPLLDVYSLAEKHWVRGGGEDWESFVLGIFVTHEVPTGFPLKTAPEGLAPEVFLTDSERRGQKTIKPTEQTHKP